MSVWAHGWVAGIARHGSVILSRGWLVTVEAPGYPRHPASIQHDAVVNRLTFRDCDISFFFIKSTNNTVFVYNQNFTTVSEQNYD